MACVVIAEFEVQEGKMDSVMKLMESENGLKVTRNYKGCNQVDLAVDTDNSNKIVLTEFWDSKEEHQTYFQWRQEGDPSGLLGELGPHMAEDPKFTWAEIKKTY